MSMSDVAGSLRRFVIAVTMPTAASDGGTAVVSLGTSFTSAMVSAVSPHMVANAGERRPAASGAPKCVSCAFVITIASPLTKPSITGCGTSRMNLPQPSTPADTCSSPARRTHALR